MKNINAVIAIFVAVAMVGIGVWGLMYYKYEGPGGEIDQAAAAARAQQASIDALNRYTIPSDIDMSSTDTAFDYSSAVNASDDVATQTWDNITTIQIENKETTGTATVRLTFQVTGEDDGLPTALEQNEMQFYIHTSTGDTWLFGSNDWDGDYHSGYTFDIAANSIITVTLASTMDDCNDVFSDGKTYHIDLYLWQPGVGVGGAGAVLDTLQLTLAT